MSLLLVGLLLLGRPPSEARTPLPISGNATYYNVGVMETVWAQRVAWGQVPACVDCVGAVAMVEKRDIGRRVWLEYDGKVAGPFMVVDCATPRDHDRFVRSGVVVEVPNWVARVWRIDGPVPMRVHDYPPRRPWRP